MDDAMTPDLLPCPFCGSAARIDREQCLDGGGVFLTVRCGKCRAKSGEKYHTHGNDCPQTYQEVRDAWNTRAALSATQPSPAEAAKVLLDAFDAVWTKAIAIEAENAREATARGKHKWPVICREGVRSALRAIAGGDQ